MRKPHDMGGMAAGAVDRSEHHYEVWEKQVDALKMLLADEHRQLVSTDELRRSIEELGPGAYTELNYYERWISALTTILIEKGIITVAELGERIEAVQIRHERAGGRQ